MLRRITLIAGIAIVSTACPLTTPKTGPSLTFTLDPDNTCAANAGNLVATWTSDGRSVDIVVTDPAGSIVKRFENLPASSSQEIAVAELGLAAGRYTAKATARANDGGTTEAQDGVNFVGRDGVWFEIGPLRHTCSAESCQSFGPVSQTLTRTFFDETLVPRHLRLTSWNALNFQVTPQQFYGGRATVGVVPICGGNCAPQPTGEAPVSDALAESPYGDWAFEGMVSPAMNKSGHVEPGIGMHLVCKSR